MHVSLYSIDCLAYYMQIIIPFSFERKIGGHEQNNEFFDELLNIMYFNYLRYFYQAVAPSR